MKFNLLSYFLLQTSNVIRSSTSSIQVSKGDLIEQNVSTEVSTNSSTEQKIWFYIK